jgi:hypothetical protein
MIYTEIYEGNYNDNDPDPDIFTVWEEWQNTCAGVDALSYLHLTVPKIASLIEDCDDIDNVKSLIQDCEFNYEIEAIDYYIDEYNDHRIRSIRANQ